MGHIVNYRKVSDKQPQITKEESMKSIFELMPSHIRTMLMKINTQQLDKLQEIRLRANKPIIVNIAGDEYGLAQPGLCAVRDAYEIKEADLIGVMKFLSGFSFYALDEEIRQGFMTLEGGHRVGVVGKVVVERGSVKTIKHISAINIRIAHQVIGCSDKVLPYLLSRQGVQHTLIVSPPKCGKTTLLRDMIRNLSNGYSGYGPYTVGVVDERSEIAGCYMGIPQNDVGVRTDVLDACPKVEGMRMLLRAMAPDVIAVDEIGSAQDMQAIEEVLGAGVSIVCTTHGKDLEDCMKKPMLKHMLEQGLFDKVIVLSKRRGPCTVENVIDLRKVKVGAV